MLQVLCFCVIASLFGGALSSANERRLVSDLLKDYERMNAKYTRPVANDDDALDISHGLSLLSIDMIDPFLDRAIVNIWQTTRWNDDMMKWDPSEYGGIKSVRLPLDKIYTPDLLIYNQERPVLKTDVLAVVTHDGGVLVVQPYKAYLSCAMENIPWQDKQSDINCSFKFGSWTTDSNLLNPTLSSEQIDVSSYTPYFGFELIRTSAKRNVVKYDCCPESYTNLEYTLTFHRSNN